MNTREIVEAVVASQQEHQTDNPRTRLLPLLQELQRRLGYLPAEAFFEIETRLGIPRHVSYSVASFYNEFQFDTPAQHVIRVCDGAACDFAGCGKLMSAISKELGVAPGGVTKDGRFRLEAVNCLGQCDRCPAMSIDGMVFGRVSSAEVPRLLELIKINGKITSAELMHRTVFKEEFPMVAPGEQRRLLAGPPHSITEMADWEKAGGLANIRKYVGRTAPAELIRIVKESGIRGLGGAGFPTGKKWELAQSYPAPRILVCNADESEPGTFKDQFLLRHRPWLVLEGMLLAGYAIGADRGFLFLRSEYAYLQPLLENCLRQMTDAGLLGAKVAGSEFRFEIIIRISAGGYICGEESALLEAIEGKRAEPRLRPPFPVESGLFGRPTVVNNVETLANVQQILGHEPAWFREVGVSTSPGTKLFSLSGDVRRPGVYELPLGAPLRDLIENCGGGVQGDLGLVILGGASGRAFGADQLDRPLDFEHQIGNGTVMVFHAGRNPLAIGANLLRFFSRETCGGCLPCRAGVPEACTLAESAVAHGLTPEKRESLDMLADCLENTARCGLGKTALRAMKDLMNLTY